MERYNIQPSFDSDLTSTLFRMESLRSRLLTGNTPPWLFYDLKATLHVLESLNSARIEGNHTTLAEVIAEVTNRNNGEDSDKRTSKINPQPRDDIAEIINIQNAINYIEENLHEGDKITLKLIREVHAITVKNLKRDGSVSPGAWRRGEVTIAGSNCKTASPQSIQQDMQELIDYINTPHEPKEDLIRIACAHHRFTVIHPFDNGNGRTARLLTYAMLIQYGFLQHKKNLLNPSSIFCADRQQYYRMLDKADSGKKSGIETWCNYVATGILNETDKMFKLLDREFAVKNIVTPAVRDAHKDDRLTEQEYKIMLVAIENNLIQAADVNFLFGNSPSDQVARSRFLGKMVDDSLLFRLPNHPKKYVPHFYNRILLPYIMRNMNEAGLVGLM